MTFSLLNGPLSYAVINNNTYLDSKMEGSFAFQSDTRFQDINKFLFVRQNMQAVTANNLEKIATLMGVFRLEHVEDKSVASCQLACCNCHAKRVIHMLAASYFNKL